MVLTLFQLVRNWRSIFDDQVSPNDREILMRTAMFILLPIAVFFHELGHAWATLHFGGTVKTFHYALLWGYVVPEGTFSQMQILSIYLAGNLIELIIGFLALIASCLVTSPALITLMTYFGVWCVGGTIILYPALSLSGMYGDWSAIYSCPLKEWTTNILVIHLILVVLLLGTLYNPAVKRWYNLRVNPHKP